VAVGMASRVAPATSIGFHAVITFLLLLNSERLLNR